MNNEHFHNEGHSYPYFYLIIRSKCLSKSVLLTVVFITFVNRLLYESFKTTFMRNVKFVKKKESIILFFSKNKF